MASKRKAVALNAATVSEEPVDPSDELMFLCLGGGNEVGRSCHIIQYKGKTVMVRPRPSAPSSQRPANLLLGSWTPASIPLTTAWLPSPSLTISTLAPSTYCSSASKFYSVPSSLHT